MNTMNRGTKRAVGDDGKDGQVKKIALNLYQGDRFCTSWSVVIRGMAKDRPRHCPKCNGSQPHSNVMWAFEEGWGRCKGHLCFMILSDEMLYCYYCGACNDAAFQKRERNIRKQLAEKMSQESKDKEKNRMMEEKEQEQLKQMDELKAIIAKQETELFLVKSQTSLDEEDFTDDKLEEVDIVMPDASGTKPGST